MCAEIVVPDLGVPLCSGHSQKARHVLMDFAGQTEFGQCGEFHLQRQNLAVNQNAIAVEDYYRYPRHVFTRTRGSKVGGPS